MASNGRAVHGRPPDLSRQALRHATNISVRTGFNDQVRRHGDEVWFESDIRQDHRIVRIDHESTLYLERPAGNVFKMPVLDAAAPEPAKLCG